MLAMGASGVASSQVFDPDMFPAGTDISTAFSGVTLSTVDSDLGDPRVFAQTPKFAKWASTGALVFGHAGEFPEHWVTDTEPGFKYGALRIDLDSPTDFISVDVIGNDLGSDIGVLTALDISGSVLAQVETGVLTSGDVFTLQVSGQGAISSVIVGGKLADTVALDRIVIPEPAAAVLLAIGSLVSARRRWR